MLRYALAGALLIALSAAAPSHAAVVTLSQLSSDETDPALLQATLEFIVSGDTLVLTVSNDSAFQIHQVYFNASDNVAGLTLTSPTSGWSLQTNKSADGFGQFDFALIGDNGIPKIGLQTILAGDSQVFTFDITPANGATVTDMDFVLNLSSIPPGGTPSLAAAKFIRGPADDSAFGAVIPLPPAATAGLVLMGAALLWSRRRALFA
jgi:hypothetical protein